MRGCRNLKKLLSFEKKNYFLKRTDYIKCKILREHEYYIWDFQKELRREEYFIKNKKNIRRFFSHIKKNYLGVKLGFFIPANVFGEGLHIWHYGNIIVNGNAQIGKNCVLHGNNCIGNNGKEGNECPVIGDNVDIGTGATIIGGVYIANNIKIGAGAVVINSFEEEGITIAGIPAKKVR